MHIWVVIAAFNEQARLPAVVIEVLKHLFVKSVVVVDDGSSKRVEEWKSRRVKVLRHEINLGKGAAMKTGADFAFTQKADAVIFMDADGQHDPQELPNFEKHLKKGNDVVLGSRRPALQTPLLRLLGNKLASIYINIFFGVYVSDIVSGYRAISRKAYTWLRWDSRRYGVETEMVARLGRCKDKLKFVELPIEAVYIDKYKGVTIIDALELLPQTLWWKLSWVFK